MVQADEMPVRRGRRFRYDAYDIDPAAGVIACHYLLDDHAFTELIRIDAPPEGWGSPLVEPAARLLHLLAGVSYWKAGAPPVIELGATSLTGRERRFLQDVYAHGLAEFAHRNGIDLSDLRIEAGERSATGPDMHGRAAGAGHGRPLVPFGGGIDSIVVAEQVRRMHDDTALFVLSRAGDRFAAIEAAAAVSGLPIVRAERELDEKVLRSRELGFLNGHVPVTGILSAIAVATAVLHGRDAVVMSNEWSASSATLMVGDRAVNHQWSKSWEFEAAFRGVLAESVPGVAYFSALRPWSELWVAERFAALREHHFAFRSCNRAFHVDPAQRLDRWCGRCDKCCFIDLILAPFIEAERLEAVFDGHEPLADDELEPKFRALLGDPAHGKPFECVGDVDECRAAALLAADRPDRAGTALLQRLAASLRADGRPLPDVAALLRPLGPHFIEPAYACADIVV
ncbi:MAG: endonuclease domain-containing protein [Frankiaceae bacterium]